MDNIDQYRVTPKQKFKGYNVRLNNNSLHYLVNIYTFHIERWLPSNL